MPEPRFRIGTVARLAGLSTHVLRIWERRYGVLTPDRSSGGARLYTDAEVDRVRLLKRAVDRGHAIGQIAGLSSAELERLAGSQESHDVRGESATELVEQIVRAVQEFDAARADELLERATVLFSGRVLVLDVLNPVLERIGDEWARGTLCTASEHIASALVRSRASSLLGRLPRERGAELVALSTPAGELHELGALLAAVTAKLQGFDVLYLGPNLPASEIARAVIAAGASVVALSVLYLATDRALVELQALLAEFEPARRVVVGGPRARLLAARLDGRVIALQTLPDFEQFLGSLRAATADS